MKFLSRVAWSEGMYLAPHHFQAQSRYFEDTVAFLAPTLSSDPWGFLHVQMDGKAVANGTVSLVHAAGIFPDGLAFDMPTSDARPVVRTISSLCESTDTQMLLYLAVSERPREGSDASFGEASSGQRFSAISRTLRDETNGLDEYDVEFAHKNIRIVSGRELTQSDVSLPIARLTRETGHQFRYDDDFIPPCLRVGASETLTHLLKRVLDSVTEKSSILTGAVHFQKQLRAGSLPMEIGSYWFLHALQSALPPLQHLVYARHTHPSECFLELSRLAGALCTFSIDSDPRALAAYDHRDPGTGFRSLASHIRRQLEIVVSSNTVALQFTPSQPYMYTAPVTDERCVYRSRWILGVRSSLGESEQLRLVPRLIKVCSSQFVPELVKRALPGMPLTYLPVPPSGLRAEIDMQYFAIDTTGPCWEHIMRTRNVGVYIPGEIADPHFTLTVILEQAA